MQNLFTKSSFNLDTVGTLSVKFQMNERSTQDCSKYIFDLMKERNVQFCFLEDPILGHYIRITDTIQQIIETISLIKELLVQVPSKDDLSQLEITSEFNDDIVIRFDISDSYMGGLIGKSGSGIQLIRRFARCRIYLEPQKYEDTYRRIKLCGNPRNVFDTLYRILYRILFLRPSLGNLPTNYPEIEEFIQSILGKHALYPVSSKTYNNNNNNNMDFSLSSSSNLSSCIQSSTQFINNISLPLHSRVPSPAKESSILSTQFNNTPTNEVENDIYQSVRLNSSIAALCQLNTNTTIEIPDTKVGYVIGKGGETIKKMRKNANCHISVEEIPESPTQRRITLQGNIIQVSLAERLIIETIQQSFL